MAVPTRAHIVVGLDNTPASAAALRWAMSEAERSGRDVLALNVQPTPAPRAARGSLPSGSAIRWAVRALDWPTTATRLTVATRTGRPGPTLVDAASRAAMLVLGVSRRAVTSGSVSDLVAHCQRWAQSEVVLVADDGQVVDRLAIKPAEIYVG